MLSAGADGDALEPAQDEELPPRRRPGHRESRVPARELLEGDAAFEAGERGAKTMVDPERERQVPGGGHRLIAVPARLQCLGSQTHPAR